MAAPELGTKQLCPQCEAKFYDLNKVPAVCPKCGHTFEPDEDEAISARAKAKAAAPAAAAAAEKDEAEEAEVVVETDEGEAEEETITELGDVDEATIPVGGMDDDEDDSGKTVPAGFTEQGVDDDDILDDDEDEFDIDVEADLEVDDALPIDDEDTK